MELNNVTWPLVSIFHYKKDINPTPEYQRYAVWSRSQQQLLMDSIYRGMDVPKLYLRETKEGPFKYEAVDGQQRLRAVWEFFENGYPLSEAYSGELGGKRYDELDMEQRGIFDHYQFSLVIIRDADDREIREMFCRLQNGKPLNRAERRNAMVSDMRDFCAKMAEHEFFQSVRFGNSRLQYQQVAAQTVMMEIEKGPATCNSSSLQKMYEEYVSFGVKPVPEKKVSKVYNLLKKCFPDKTPELKRGYVVSFYLLLSKLSEEYNLNGHETTVREFLIDFDHRRRTNEDDNEMVRFNERMSHASDGEPSLRYRHEMLLREFHQFCPNLIPIDPKRGFDELQRTAIYRRDGGKCKYCGDDVAWDNFHADHVVPHSTGGPTTVENGWLACSSCNQKKGKKPVSSDS